MNKATEQFLQQFDSHMRTHIIAFAQHLTTLSQKNDVIIFLARKAACMGDCFRSLKLSSFHCVTTSSRVLDMNLAWLRGKRVAIVDDMLISGTTINRALKKLSNNGITNVKVYVLSTDKSFFNPAVVNVEQPHLSLPNHLTICTCSNIVKAISATGRPYTIDYPLYRDIALYKKDFLRFRSLPGWITYDTTPLWLYKNNVLNLTIIPDCNKASAFLQKIGLICESEIILKIRLYARKVSRKFICSIQPIVILPELSQNELYNLYENIINEFREFDLSYWNDGTTSDDSMKSRLRILQYLIATELASLLHEDFSYLSKKNIIFEQCIYNLRLIFPGNLSETIHTISQSNRCNFNNLRIKQKTTSSESCNEILNQKEFDNVIATYKLTNPFIESYKNEELKARELVRVHGADVFNHSEYKDVLERLNRGVSIDRLKKEIAEYSNSTNIGQVVSNFLDTYIDRGSIVPISYVHQSKIYRAFRHGENVEFSREELTLFTYMLGKVKGNQSCLQKTYIEKLLVLFVRAGIQKGFLNCIYGTSYRNNILSIHYHLHGAMVQQSSTRSEKYIFNQNESIKTLLEDEKRLIYDESLNGYNVRECSADSLDDEKRRGAEEFAYTMNKILFELPSKPLKTKEIALLASCSTLIDLASAMAAEIYIFSSRYYNEFGRILKQDFISIDTKISANIRETYSFMAINSGCWKFTSFKENKPREIYERVNNELAAATESIYLTLWESFFPRSMFEAADSSPNQELSILVKDLAQTLFHIHAYINEIELSSYSNWQAIVNSKAYQEILRINDYSKKYFPQSDLSLRIENVLRQAEGGRLKREDLYQHAISMINGLKNNRHLDDLLLRTHCIISNNHVLSEMDVFRNFLYICYGNCPPNLKADISNHLAVLCKDDIAIIPDRQIQKSPSESAGSWLCFSPNNVNKASQLVLDIKRTFKDAAANFSFSFYLMIPKMIVTRDAYSSDFQSVLFRDIAKEIENKSSISSERFSVNIYACINNTEATSIKNKIITSLSQQYNLHLQSSNLNYSIPPYNFIIDYTIMEHINHSEQTHLCDIGVICIKSEELSGIRQGLPNLVKTDRKGCVRNFFHGSLYDKNKQQLSVIVTRAMGQGNQSIIAAYNDLTTNFSPQYVVLLGIAGGINKKLKIGDVVIANNVLYYEQGAETNEGREARPNMHNLSTTSKLAIQNLQNEKGHDDMQFSAVEPNTHELREFKCYLADIASGEKVIKDKKGEIRKYIESLSSNIYAVETEATGFSVAFNEQELSPNNRPKGIFIIRGISDLADIAKSDEHQILASRHAMHVLKELCAANEIQPANKPIS